MDLYHIWCSLKPGVKDTDFARNVAGYLGHLREAGDIEAFRLTRRKLGLGPAELLEFHIMVEVKDLAHLDGAFSRAAARTNPVEGLHHAVNSLVSKVKFALYRDFPDAVREEGQERF